MNIDNVLSVLDFVKKYNKTEFLIAFKEEYRVIWTNYPKSNLDLYSLAQNNEPEMLAVLIDALNENGDLNENENYSIQAILSLMSALKRGYTEVLTILLQSNLDLDKTNVFRMTALMHASFHGEEKLVNLLLNSDINVDVDKQDNLGWTALMFACHRGHVKIVKLLLESGADKSLVNSEGNIAVYYAMRNNYHDIVELL